MAEQVRADIDIQTHADLSDAQKIANEYFSIRDALKEINALNFTNIDSELDKLSDRALYLIESLGKIKGTVDGTTFGVMANDITHLMESLENTNDIADYLDCLKKINALASEIQSKDDLELPFENRVIEVNKLGLAFDGLKEKMDSFEGDLTSSEVSNYFDKMRDTISKMDALSADTVDRGVNGGYNSGLNSDISVVKDAIEQADLALREGFSDDKIIQLIDNFRELKDDALGVPSAVNSAEQSLNNLGLSQEQLDQIKLFEEYIRSIDSDGSLENAEQSLNRLSSGLNEINTNEPKSAVDDLNDALKQNENIIEDSEKAFDRYSENVKSASGNIDEASTNLSQTSDSLEDVGDSASDSSIDIEGVKKALGNMTGTSKLADGNMVKLAKSLGLSGAQAAALGIAFTAVVAIVKYMNEQMDEFIGLLKDGAGDIGSGFIDVLKDIPDMLSEMVDALQEANEQMLEFAEAGSEIENAYRVMYNYFGQDAGDKVADYADNLESVFGLDATGVIDQIGKLESTVTKLTSSKDQIDSLTQSLDMFARDLSAFAGEDYAKVVSDLSRAISNGSVMKGSSLYDIMSKNQIGELKDLETEQERYNYIMKNSSAIKGAYTRYLDTEAGKIEILKQQYSSFTGNVQQLVLGLYAKVAPILTNLLQFANAGITSLMKLFKIDVTRATGNVQANQGDAYTNRLKNMSTAMDKVSKSSKKAQRSLASFDDVIQLNKNDNSNNDLTKGAKDLANMDYSGFDLFGDNLDKANKKWQDFIKKFKEAIEKGDFKGAGKLLSSKLIESLKEINWKDIQKKAGDFGKNFGQFLQGLFSDPELGTEIGNAIAQLLNTAVDFLYELGLNFPFAELGTGIAKAWRAFWDNFDTEQLADTFYIWIKGIFKTLGNYVAEMDLVGSDGLTGWEKTGKKIADFINKFFSDFSDEDIKKGAEGVIGFIDGVFKTIAEMIDDVDWQTMAQKVHTMVNEMLSNMLSEDKDGNSKAFNWSKTIGRLINNILVIVKSVLTDSDKRAKVQKIIKDFFDGLDLANLLDLWGEIKTAIDQIKWQIILEIVKAKFVSGAKKLGSALLELVKAIGLLWVSGFLLVFVNIPIAIYREGKKVKSWLVYHAGLLFGKLYSIFTDTLSKIGKKFKDWWDKSTIKKVLDWIADKISSLSDGLSSLTGGSKNKSSGGVFNSVKNWITGKSVSKQSAMNYKAVSGVSADIPMLAKGGIVKQATQAVIGEAGKEAVLPLESNTKWMDQLAKNIADKIKTPAGGNGSVVIDMSKFSKLCYTRSEMVAFGKLVADSLKAYGVKVSFS